MGKLLLADDEPYVTNVLKRKLRPYFEEILTASDGEEALVLARRELPSLIVSDYQMPGMNGYTLACQLRADRATAGIPIILLTARGHLLTDEQLSQTSIRRLLSKPFGVRELIEAIGDILPDLTQRSAA